MIPKYLKIKGLYSYQKEQEIHFDALTDASLFGIFGAVGSGKSSILEAITFALYGDTERLNRSGDDRTYNMMNLKSSELLIDFECLAGKEGAKYRFTVKGKRNSKNFKEVKTFERKAYIWQDENWLPLDENQHTEQIIGLSYDNFRRTIIIPQGKFQEFIELKDAQRTLMMKELFHLEKYDLSRNVAVLSKENDLEISNVTGQLTGLGEINVSMIEACEKQHKQVLSDIELLHTQLQRQTEQELKHQKLKRLFEKVQALEIQKKGLEEQRAEMDLREKSLRQFEICAIHFKTYLDQKKSIASSMERQQLAFEQNQTKIKELEAGLSVQKSALTDLRKRYEERDSLLQNARELENVRSILEQTSKLVEFQSALARGEEKWKLRTQELAELKQRRIDKQILLDEKKAKFSDMSELSQVKSWFTLRDEYVVYRESIKAEAERLKKDLDACIVQRASVIGQANQQFALSISADAALMDINKIIEEYLSAHDVERENIARQKLKFNIQSELQRHAKDLEEGVPCPLCGSAHHPGVQHENLDTTGALQTLDKQVISMNQQDQLIRKFQLQIEKSFNEGIHFEKQKDSIRSRFVEAKKKLEVHQLEFVWKQFDAANREAFEIYFNEVSQAQQSIKAEEVLIKNMAEQWDTLLLDTQEKVEKPIQKIKNDLLEMNSRIETLKNQLKVVDLTAYADKTTEVVTEEMVQLQRAYEQITASYELVSKQIEQGDKEVNTLQGSQETLQLGLKNAILELQQVQERIGTELDLHHFESEEAVQQVLAQQINIAHEKQSLQDYRLLYNNTSRDLALLHEESAGEIYHAEAHAALLSELETLTQQLNVNKREEGRLDGLLKKMQEDLNQQAVLLKKKEQHLVRKEHLDELAKLFRSSGFVDYASSIYLQNLIEAANQRFHQMTHQRLHLELGEGNSFWVRDLLNGGHMRLLKTLSGGQKFQAALSLALALADHIHVKNKSVHNFFFLDEGFGSLDKNALATVFDTLKSLRKENRIVGIISHVEDLQQEIQTYLTIEETDEGSVISESWK
jgi:exonuclease SbcC